MQPDRASVGRPSLASIQTAVMSLITGRDEGAVVPDAGDLIVSDTRASADERLHVYQHMYRARIVEALESQFPRLARNLGADAFAELAAAYITDEPSCHPSLRYVGERLPGWLAARRADAPMLIGLATLEWARADVFDLADDAAMTLTALRDWPPDRFGELPLRLVTAHRLITAPGGTAALWDALGTDVVAPAEPTSGNLVDAETETLLIWRDGTVVYHRGVDAAEYAALRLAAAGTHFGVVCESLLAAHGEEPAVAQAYAWMSTWLADGLVQSVRAK